MLAETVRQAPTGQVGTRLRRGYRYESSTDSGQRETDTGCDRGRSRSPFWNLAGGALHRLDEEGRTDQGSRENRPRPPGSTRTAIAGQGGGPSVIPPGRIVAGRLLQLVRVCHDNSTGNTYTKVSANWIQPGVTCPAYEDEVAVFWVGLDGFNNTTVEQDGTLAQCFEGSAFYYTWWEMYPTNSITEVGSTVKPGDHITASVSFAGGKYTLGVMDPTTTGNGFSLRKTCATDLTCANASAEWIAETPSYSRGYAPWPSFGTWKVTSAKATGSGAAGVISSFPDDQITIVGSFGEDLADTGTLNTAGNGFSDAWAFTW